MDDDSAYKFSTAVEMVTGRTFAVLRATFLQSGKMLTDHAVN